MTKRFIAMLLLAIIFTTLPACAFLGLRPAQSAGVGSQSGVESVSITRPLADPELQDMNAAAAMAVRLYVEARIKTDAFVAADFPAMTAGTTAQMIDELVTLWDDVSDQTSFIQNKIAAMKNMQNGLTAKHLSACAGKLSASSMAESTFDPKTWAENFTKQYDSIKGANTIKQLAAQLGTDAKEAYSQLTLAQDIIRSGAAEDAAYYDKLTKIAQATKTACKVGLFVTATIATGGGTLGTLAASSMTLGQAGAVIVGGTDCIVDVATTGSTIILGEGSQVTVAAEGLKEKLAPVSAVVGLVTFNSSSSGEQISYIGETLSDWLSEGKILGIKVTGNSDGATVMANAITTAGMTPQQLAQELQKAGFVAPPDAAQQTGAPTQSAAATPVAPTAKTPVPTGETATPPASSAPPSGDKLLSDEELSGTYSVTVDNGTGTRSYEAKVHFAAGTATIEVEGEDTLTFTVSGNTITTHLGSPINADMVITFSKEGDTIVGRGSMIVSVSGGASVEMKYVYIKTN